MALVGWLGWLAQARGGRKEQIVMRGGVGRRQGNVIEFSQTLADYFTVSSLSSNWIIVTDDKNPGGGEFLLSEFAKWQKLLKTKETTPLNRSLFLTTQNPWNSPQSGRMA